MAERPLYTLYKNLKAQNYDVPDDYNKFESALTRDGKGGADNRHAIYENLKAQNFDVPDTYERFYSALFEPRSKTSSRAKGGSVPMTAADRARFSVGAQAISASAQQTMNNAGRYNRLKQRKQKQQKDFGRVNLGTHQTPYGGDANNVVKDDFAYNPETGKAGAYVTSDNENAYTQNDAEQKQNLLDKYGEEWNNAVDMGIVPSELDKADPDLSDTDVAMRQMERRQEWLNENQDRRSKELNESMHLQGSPFVASGGAVAPSSFNTAISNEANRLSDVEYGAYNTAKAYNQMLRTTLLQELKEQKQRNENAGWWKDKWNDVSNYFGAMFNTMLDPKLYSQGIMDAAISNNLLQVKKGMEEGTIKKGSNAGNAAQAMLGAIQQQQGEAAKQQQYGTKAYQYGDMSGRSLKFMADFALSGWRNVMTTGFTKAGEKVGEKMALGALGKWFTKNTGRVLGDIAGSAALAATNQLGSTYNNVIERYVGMNNENGGVTQDKNGDLKFNEGVSLGKAIKDGFGSATIENFSEMFGEYLPGASKLLSKLGLSKVSSFFEKIGNNAYYKWLSNATNKSGIQGVMAEISEEEFGTALHAAWGDGDGSWSDFNVFTNPDAREKQIDTCLGMFYSVGFMQAPRTAVGAINAVQYFNIKHQVAKADKFGQMMFNDKWDEIKSKIDVTTNADLTKTVLDATRSDSMTAKQKGAVINYAMFLSKLRGFNQASDAKTKDKVEEGDTAPTLSNDLDDAYTEGHNADDADKHNIQLEQNDKANELAAMLHITPEQLHDMADEDLKAMTGQDDKLDQAIYDYQVSTAKYQGVMDGAQDEVDMAAQQAAMETDNMTDLSRGTVRKATLKATGGLEDYEVYIISGNIATHDDGSIDVGNSDDMIIYYDPTTGRKEHADAMMFADLIEELPAADVKAQAIIDAKENAIKKVAGIIDGTVEVGSQFSVTDVDGTEHTYEVLADNGDGTAMITIDGNIPTELVNGENVNIPVSFEELQKMKDASDQQRLQTAKAQREQMEKERAEQQTQNTEQTQPSFDINQILNDDGNVVLADVLGKDGNTKYPNSQLFLIRDSGAKAKVMELTSDGSLIPHAVNKKDVRTATTMTLDEYKQAFAGSSMIEDNSGTIEADRGGIEVDDNTQPLSEADADNVIAQMESSAETAPDLELTPDNWAAEFGEDGIVSTPIGDVKMGENQVAKLFEKGRSKEFGMIKPTLTNPDVIIEVPSHSADGNEERSSSYLFIKTFLGKNGKKVYYFKSVTIKKDGLEISISSHYDRAKRVKEALMKGKLLYRKNDGAQTEQNQPSTSVTTSQEDAAGSSESKDTNISANGNENNESLTFEDGTPIPVDENGETDLSQTDAAHAAEWYDNNLGEDADDWLDGEIKKAKKVLEQAQNKKVTGTKPSELVASKKEKEAAIADAQAHYDSAISIRDALKERQLAKVEDTAEGRKELIEKARRKFARLKSAVKDDAEAVAQLYKETVGTLLHRLYDGTGIDVTDTIPLTAEEYVASNLGAHSLNYEGTETSKGVKQETGLSREDFAKTQLLAADGKGTTIDNLVHSLWENRPSNLESLGTQEIRNALLSVLTSGFKASEARNYIENLRIAQAENMLEEQKKAADNAAFAEENKAESESQTETAPESEENTGEENSDEINDEENEKINEQTNENINTHEQNKFPDKLREGSKAIEVPDDATDEKPLGEQRTKSPFLVRENGKQQTETESDADVEKNKVDDMKVVDNIVGEKTRKTLEKIAKIMGANIQWLYSNKQFNGKFDEKTNTIYLTLDSSITEGVQFIFGHEMTHEMRTKNPAAYDELKTLVKNMMGEDAFNSETDKMQKRYRKGGARYWNDRNAIEEEVVADQLGIWIRDANYAHTLLLKMSHPLLARLHEIVNRFLMALHGTEFSDDMRLILRSIEQAYVKTANGQVTNSETGEDVSFSLRQKPEPKKKGIGYKVFVLKDGKLYPPMVANPDGAATPVGVWLDADAAPIAGESKTGRPQVKQGGKGTQGGSGKLAYRPGWHLGVVPYAIQFNRKDADGNKTLFPKNFVFAEVEYAADVDYQEEARQEGINPSGKYQHSLAGLKHLPTDGYYMYRTNPNPETDPWVITGAMKVNRILTRAEQADLVSKAGREPQQIQEGDIVTDDVVNSINQEIADAPKFSLKVYHGSGAEEDDTNYVIFKPEDMRITEHTKFSLKDPFKMSDNEKKERGDRLIKAPAVDVASGVIQKTADLSARKAAEKWWNENVAKPLVFNTEVGDVEINDKSIKDSLAHRYRQPKLDAITSLPDGFGNAVYLGTMKDFTRDGDVNNHYFAYPINYDGQRNYVFCRAMQDANKNRLYVHEVFVADKINEGNTLQTTASQPHGGIALYKEILANVLSAAKIDNSSETAKENDEKFSLKDEKTLAGVHNITEEKLLKAIKQGGLANPSVAVIDSSKQNHEDYGDISLILPSDKVAKRTGKNAGTWQGDAWTPTYPQVERQMSNKGAEKASKDVASVPNDMYSEVRRGLDRWLDGGEPNSAMAYMFLHEKGVAPEPKKIQPKFSDEAYNELKSITAGDFNIYGIGKADAKKVLDMYIEAKFDGDKALYEEKTKAWLERNKSIVDAGTKGGMRYAIAKENVELYDEYGFNYKGVQTFVRDVEYDHRRTGVDMNATLNEVEDYIKTNNLTDEFNTWLEGKEKEYGIKEVIFDGFTPSGNRRYVPNTLENVSKIMKKQGRNGATGTSVSFQNFAAKLMPSYGTLKDIRSKKGLLTSDHEDLDKFNEKWANVFFELGMKCQPDATGTFDDYGLARLSEAAMTSDPQAYLKKEYNVDFSDEDTKRLKEMVKAIKEEYPAMYFETKFERPVGFDEFSSAVVPTTASNEVKQALQNAGVQIYEYDKEKEGDRSRAFNEAINSSDNIRFSLKSMMSKPEGWKQANKKAIHIAEAIERDPKFSLKNLDGTLIKAGTYFSGGGLVEEGLKGIIDPVVAVEYDEKISGVYRNNFGQHIVTADVRDVDPKELVKQIDGEVEYFHASPVCKNYSQAKSNHAEVELDKETAASTAEFINAIKPKVVTIENVKGYKDSDAMKTITDALDANGYTWDADVYNAADYGGYTNRERLIVRAVRDGKLPEKPKKMAHKNGWYEAVADIIPTLNEKKNGVAPWMDIRLKADGVDWRNIDKPLYVMGSAYADGKIPHAFADELLPTLRTKSGDVIVMPDGKVYRAMGRVLARVSGVSDDYKMPFSENLSHTIIGNGIPTQLTEHVIAPLLTGSDPKFSIRTYHGTGASFDKFDLSHALEGEGSESFGHGVYVTNSSKIGREYAQRAKNRKMEDLYKNMRYPDGVKGDIFKRRVFGEMVNDVATGGSVASAKEFAKKRVGADANDIQRTLENLKDREKGTEYEQNLKDRLAEYKEGLKWIDSLDEDYLTQGNANRYDVDIPDDNGSNYLDWEGIIPDSLDKQKVAEDAYKVVSDNQGFNDFKATPLNDFIAHTLKTYVNTTDVAGRVEKLKSDIKDVIENYVADDDVLALNEYLKDATPDDVLATIWYNDLVRDIKDADLGEELYRKLSTYVGDNAASQILSDNGLVGIKYPAGMIHGGAKEGDYNYVIFDENNANIVGNTRFSLRYDQFEHDLNQWKKDNNLPKDAQRPTIPQRNAGESAVDFLRRVDEYRKQMALWKTAPTYEQHLLSDDTALGEFNRELQRGSVLKRIAFQDSMLAIRKAQEAIMKEVGVDRLNMAEDAYTAENRSHGKGKNEFEEYNNEFLQPLRKAYHQMKKILGDSYDNVRIYMMAKHGLERDAQMAFKKSLDADFEDVAQRSAAYRAYKGDMNRITNDSDLEFGRVDFNTWRQRDNALRTKYSPSYMDYRYDENGIAYDYSGLSALFGGSDFEEAAHKLVRDIESSHVAEVQDLWNATNAATKKILRDGYKAGMMSKDTYLYVRDMYSHYIPLRGWDGTTADQVWDYVGGGKGAFNQTLKTAHGRTSIANDPIAYIENMAESGILLNNKNWVKQHLMLLAQNHPTSLLTLSKAWYVKSTDVNGNEEWIPATPQITSQMNSNQVKAAIDAFEQNMEQMAQTGDATQQRDGLNIAYPQTHSEEREHEVRVMKDGEEYVIYVNGDPQLAQAMNNTRAHRVREIQSGKLDRAAAWLGRKMAAAYTSLSPLFIPSNYFRDLTMTLASTAIREDAKYNYLLRKNLATSWNLGFMLRDYQNGKLREKVNNGNATPKEQMFYDFMMNGGETGFVSSLDVEDLKKKFKNDLKDLDRWKANPVKVGHTIMDSIEFLNRAIEDSNRFAVYMTSIQYGRSIDEAVNDAKDVTLNFNRKGTGEYGWQMIRNLYLFINPAVQSLQTLGALAKHHPFKFTAVTASWLASGVLVPIVNAALMSLFGGDDDKDKYWQFTKWDRRNNLIMWVPFTHEYVKIPLAQEFRAFYGIGDMIASKMMGGELAEESWSQYGEDLLGQVVDMLPLDPTGYDGNIAVSLMPNAIRPVFELAFNVDFTGKPLFKDTEYNKYDPNFTKAYVGTPDWLVRVSRMVNSIGNDYPDVQQNSIDAFGDPRYNLNNPAVVDHVLSSYLGGAYTMGSQVLGVLTKSLNDPKEIKVADIPLVSKFVSNPDDRPVTKKQGDEFWDMKENHDRAANTLSKLKKQAKVDGDYSMLERFYGSEEYKQYKQDDVKVKKYEEDKKKERAEESGEEYRPHKLNAEDIYKAHATPKDDFEDLKLKQLYTKLNGFKTSYDLLLDTAPSQSDGYYNTNKAAIDAIDEISLDKQEISELKKGFLDEGKDAYNADDMKRIRELRKNILAVLEKANKVVVANQKAKAEK